jgi:hypothetical protein
VTAWLWLLGTLVSAAGSYLLGWPAWQQYRSRESRDLNTDRYLAWRGRASRPGTSASEGMTGEERRRIYLGAFLGLVAVFCLVGFFSYL